MSKKTIRKTELEKRADAGKVRQLIMLLIIILLTVGLNIVTVRNYYNLDDYHIAKNNPDYKQGISGIPGMFTSLYATESGLSYGYRPLVRASFAIEYDIFGNDPYMSHFFNVLLYLIAVLMFYKVLRRLLKDHHPLLPFVITLIFLAHPVRTEIVASLKNRDEILAMIFCFWSLDRLVSYAETNRTRYLVTGMSLFFISFFAKATSTAFVLIIPLSLYFFTSLDIKKTLRILGIMLAVGLLSSLLPYLWLPERERPLFIYENPLPFNDSFTSRIAYGGFTLFYYLKLLVFPHPLRYYYGYNMFPDISLSNWIVIVSIIFHAALLAYAIWKLRDKSLLSFAILAYFASIAMFTNVVRPAPGIIAERFLTFPLIGFSIAIGYLFFKLFRLDTREGKLPAGRLAGVLGFLLLFLIPYSAKTVVRNMEWRTDYTLYKADMPFLYNSVRANDLLANRIMEEVNRELAKPVNVLKFVEPQVKEAIGYWERSAEILPSFSSAYLNLGIIYSRIYKNYDTAMVYFNKVLEYEPDNPQAYFNMGMTYEGKEEYLYAIDMYRKVLKIDSLNISTHSRLANVYFGLGEFREAIRLNQEIMRIDPGEALPYVNIGNYYIFQRDTLSGINFYEKAVELGAPPEASYFLSKYYAYKGDVRKSNFYQKMGDDLKKEMARP